MIGYTMNINDVLNLNIRSGLTVNERLALSWILILYGIPEYSYTSEEDKFLLKLSESKPKWSSLKNKYLYHIIGKTYDIDLCQELSSVIIKGLRSLTNPKLCLDDYPDYIEYKYILSTVLVVYHQKFDINKIYDLISDELGTNPGILNLLSDLRSYKTKIWKNSVTEMYLERLIRISLK